MSLWATLMLFGVDFVFLSLSVLWGVGLHVGARLTTRLAQSERWAVRVAAFPAAIALPFTCVTVMMVDQFALAVPYTMLDPDWRAPDDGHGEPLLAWSFPF